MRKLMLGMLLAAGAAVPTLATAAETTTATQDRPPEAGRHHGGPGGERPQGQPRAEQPRPASQPAAPQPRPQPAPQPQVQAQAQAQAQGRFEGRGDRGFRADAASRGNDGNRFGGGGGRFQGEDRARFGNGDPRRFDQGNRQPQQGQPPQAQPPQAQPQQARPQQDRGYRGPQGRFQGGPAVAPGSGGYRAQGNGYRPDAYGRGPGSQYRPGPRNQGQFRPGGGNWSRGWRDDHRYDWGRYRAENRYAFRLPRYDAPRGWGYGYRRFSPGFTLSAVLFDQGFWIGDPYAYRLPPAYYPYQWVRYYDDALLVDVRTGYVVDTVYDIFW